jgi:hypothetical protein
MDLEAIRRQQMEKAKGQLHISAFRGFWFTQKRGKPDLSQSAGSQVAKAREWMGQPNVGEMSSSAGKQAKNGWCCCSASANSRQPKKNLLAAFLRMTPSFDSFFRNIIVALLAFCLAKQKAEHHCSIFFLLFDRLRLPGDQSVRWVSPHPNKLNKLMNGGFVELPLAAEAGSWRATKLIGWEFGMHGSAGEFPAI